MEISIVLLKEKESYSRLENRHLKIPFKVLKERVCALSHGS